MKGDFAFQLIKNLIIEQNKILLQQIAKSHNLDLEELIAKYLKPEYYLPYILD